MNRRIQYRCMLLIQYSRKYQKILLKIEKLNFYDSITIELKEIDVLNKYYDNNWYKKLFTNEHLLQTIIILDKSDKIKMILKKWEKNG